MGLILALVSLASAHRPHAVVRAMIPEPDFAATGRAWAIADPGGASNILHSADWGRHWDYVGGEPQDDTLIDLTWSDGRLVVLSEEGHVWHTADAGASWESFALPLAPDDAPVALTATSTGVAIATDDGLWYGPVTDPTAFLQSRAGSRYLEVKASADNPDELTLVAGDGTVWRSTDGGATLERLGFAGDQGIDGVGVGGRVYMGTLSGLYAWDGASWGACGELPIVGRPTEDHALEVPLVYAEPDGTVWVASGQEALFRSTDGCATFERHPASDVLIIAYGGSGGAGDSEDQWRDVLVSGDRVMVAGFGGIAWSDDDASSFVSTKVLGANYVRGLALAPDWPLDERIAVGTYGGGVIVSDDAGETWAGAIDGLPHPYTHDLSVSPDFATDQAYFWTGPPYLPCRTADAAGHWETMEEGFGRTRAIEPIGPYLFMLGEYEEDETEDGRYRGRLGWSEDDGETWTELPSVGDVTGTSNPQDVTTLTTGSDTTILLSVDWPARLARGTFTDQWELIYEGADQERSAGVAVWGGTRLVYALEYDGVVYWDTDRSPTPDWVPASVPPTGHPRRMQRTPAGTLVLVDRGNQFWRSDDGGDTWYAMGTEVAPSTHEFSMASNFESTGAIAQGTQDGVYWTTDFGTTWTLYTHYERFENDTHHLVCEGACEHEGGSGKLYDGWLKLVPPDSVTFTFKGTWFELVLAEPLEDAELIAWDGETPLGTLTPDHPRIDGLALGWHDIRVEVGLGTVRVDAVEVGGNGGARMVQAGYPVDTGGDSGTDSGDDTGSPGGDDSAPGVDTDPAADDSGIGSSPPLPRCGCGSAEGWPGPLAWLGAALLLGRRPRRPGGMGN